MEKQLLKPVDDALERGIQDSSPDEEKEKSQKDRGFHSKDEKEEDKKKEGSKREKVVAAMAGLGATLKKMKHKKGHRKGSGKEEGGGEEEHEGDGGVDEEGRGKFSAFISMFAEAFEE